MFQESSAEQQRRQLTNTSNAARRPHNNNNNNNNNGDKSCSALTEIPIRKFRINHKCYGKLTFLTKESTSNKCNCRKGLHFELVQ